MILPPIIPIAFLVLGALAVGAADLARLRRPSLFMMVAAGLALAAMLALRADGPITQVISGWLPISVFGVPVSFRVDTAAWIMGLGLIVACLATALTWVAYPGKQRPAPRAVSLLFIACALVSVFASNLLTLALAWGLLDVVFIMALLVRSGSEMGRRAALAIVLNTASTLCVWVAALLIENSHESLYWNMPHLASGPQAWLAAAVVLRLGLYPLHQWLPIELGKEPDRAVLLIAVPSAVGLALWARMSIAHALPADSFVPVAAALSAIVGAVLAWRSPRPRVGLPYVALSLAGLAMMNTVVPASVGNMTATTLNWLFIVICLFISRGLDRRSPWWLLSAVIAGLSIAGIPGTLGFVTRQQMITGLIDTHSWSLLAVCLIAEAVLIAATIRLIVSPATEQPPSGPLRQISFGLAQIIAALPLLLLVLKPGLIADVPSIDQLLAKVNVTNGLAWVLPIILGIILALLSHRFAAHEAETSADQPVWSSWLRLEWVVSLAAIPIRWITRFVRGIASLIEGEGGLVWALVVIVVAVVLTSGAIK